ncbi:MAG: hypothetical protein ACRDAJ_09015 [Serratia fonticola]
MRSAASPPASSTSASVWNPFPALSYCADCLMSLLLPQALQLEYQTELASIEGAREVEIHLLKENDDLQKIALELEQWVKKQLKNRPVDNVSRLFMDITYATPVRSAAALFCSLDQDIELIQGPPDGTLSSYDLVCKVQE